MADPIISSFLAGRGGAEDTAGSQALGESSRRTEEPDRFRVGVEWVSTVLQPALDAANKSLAEHGVAFTSDTNLDPRSTNHAHADVRMVQLPRSEGGNLVGRRHSVNVLGGREVRVYPDGQPDHVLGTVEEVKAPEVTAWLSRIAEEFGRTLRS